MSNLFHCQGEFYLTAQPKPESHYSLLVFRGSPAFLQRCENWSAGSELIRDKGLHIYDQETRYLRASWNSIQKAIAATFEWEVIQERDSLINYTKKIIETEESGYSIEIDWDEEVVKRLAWAKMLEFVNKKLVVRNVLKNLYNGLDKDSGEFHGVGSISDTFDQ